MTLHIDSINELPEPHRQSALEQLGQRQKLDSSGIKPQSGSPRRNKYGAVKTMYRGVLFDSRKEARHAYALDLELNTGTVLWWCYHPQFLLPGGIIYEADFIVVRPLSITKFYSEVKINIEDVKSKPTKTAAYRMKKKLMLATYGITIREI